MLKQFEEQFGKEWVCTCTEPFKASALEIISENKNSLIAHYTCPNCSREQMLAAAVRASERRLEGPTVRLPQTSITADDVLDIKQELKSLKFAPIKNLDRHLFVSRLTDKI